MANEELKQAKANARGEKAKAKAMRPWYKKKRLMIPLILVIFIVLVAITGGSEGDDSSTQDIPAVSTEDKKVDDVVEAAESDDSTSDLTPSQQNAVRSAVSYLSFSGFSRQGLIDQLSSDAGDQYPVEDATLAVDSLDTDYNEQAKKSAENYLSISGFSCQGLIDQLSSDAGDKYTPKQAQSGAKAAGAC